MALADDYNICDVMTLTNDYNNCAVVMTLADD